MKDFYLQEKMKIKKLNDYKSHVFHVEVPEKYSIEFFKKIDDKMENFFSKIEATKYPTLFRIQGDFDKFSEEDELEKVNFISAILNLFISRIATNKQIVKEKRLGIPDKLKNFHLGSMNLMRIVNNEILFPNFSVEIFNLKGEEVYKVVENEDTHTNSN